MYFWASNCDSFVMLTPTFSLTHTKNANFSFGNKTSKMGWNVHSQGNNKHSICRNSRTVLCMVRQTIRSFSYRLLRWNGQNLPIESLRNLRSITENCTSHNRRFAEQGDLFASQWHSRLSHWAANNFAELYRFSIGWYGGDGIFFCFSLVTTLKLFYL